MKLILLVLFLTFVLGCSGDPYIAKETRLKVLSSQEASAPNTSYYHLVVLGEDNKDNDYFWWIDSAGKYVPGQILKVSAK